MSASKRSVSDYLGAGPGAFFFHKHSEAEGLYNYYGFMHRSGNTYIMRETISTGEAKYADGGFKLANWANRVTLTYTDIQEL